MKSLLLFTTLFVLLFLSCDSDSAEKNKYLDLVIKNGVVTTLNPKQPSASTILIKDGRIVDVLLDDAFENRIGPTTKTIDAKGNFVMPG